MPTASFRATVLALALGQLFGWAFLYFGFTSFVLPMRQAFGWTEPELMGAFTLGLAAWGVASYGVGAAIDHGHGRALMSWGAVLAGAGFAVWSRAESLATVYVAWAMIGTSMAMLLYDPAFSILAKREPGRYRGAIGVLTLFGGFGSTLSFTSVTWMIAHTDWRTALLLIGAVLAFVVAPLHAWALREAPRSEGRDASSRQAAAGEPDGSRDLASSASRSAPEGESEAPAGRNLREAGSTPAFWLLAATFTLYAFTAAGIWAHAMPALASKGLTPEEALRVLVWFGPAQVLGRFVFLWVGRHRSLPTRAVGLAVFAALAASVTTLALAEHPWVLLAFSVAFGASNGLVTIVRGAIVPEYFGHTHVGRVSGAMSGVSLLVRAFAPITTAWALVTLGGYRPMLLLLAGLSVMAVITFASARRPPAGS